jgi:hypothetical protein
MPSIYNVSDQGPGTSATQVSEPQLGLEAKEEDTRRVIAAGLIVILGLTLMVCLYLYYIAVNADATAASVAPGSPANASSAAATSNLDQAKDSAQVLASSFLTPIVGLVGTALGFYFGGRSRGGTSS